MICSHGPFIEALQDGMTDDLDDLLNESTNSARCAKAFGVLQAIRLDAKRTVVAFH
jgi:hypothetical protein